MPTFNISEFSSQIAKRGIAQTNTFLLRMQPPKAFRNLVNEIETDYLEFFCRTVDLPELAVQTVDFKPRGFGPSERRPTMLDYPNLPTVFMVDSNFGVLKFFHRWMQEIVNYNIESGQISETRNTALLPYEFGYKDDYASSIQVILYSGKSEDKFYNYNFGNAYPISIGNITSSWENAAEVMTLPVSFSYDELTVSGTDRGVVFQGGNRAGGSLKYLASQGSFGQAISSSTERPIEVQDAINRFTTVNQLYGNLS